MKRELEHRDASAAAAAQPSADLITDLRHLIDPSRHSVAQAVNTSLTLLFWQPGATF